MENASARKLKFSISCVSTCFCVCICVKEIHTCLFLRLNLRLGLHLRRKCEPGLIAWFSRHVNARLNFLGSIPLNLSRVSINYVPILKQRYGKTNTMHSFIRQR